MATHRAAIIIDAPAPAVFEALTKPELVKLWQFNKEVITDWKTGSEIKFRVELEGKVLEQWGTILEMRVNELVKYNLFTPQTDKEDKIENYNVTSYLLTEQNGQTNVEIIQEDNRATGFIPVNLTPVIAGLKKVVENNLLIKQ
ncbi:MAG: SRPBCC domain-containing protein [Bacteroidia bacterium]